MSAKSMTQPVSAPGSPETRSSIRNEWPCRRAHLWPSGTLGSRCAASMVKTLKMSMAKGERRGAQDSAWPVGASAGSALGEHLGRGEQRALHVAVADPGLQPAGFAQRFHRNPERLAAPVEAGDDLPLPRTPGFDHEFDRIMAAMHAHQHA